MQTVTVSRTFDASADALQSIVSDIGPFMRASGFDDVTVDGDMVVVANDVGIISIELRLQVTDDETAALAYEQVDGIFESMRTTYELRPTDEGTTLVATTEFALDAALVGDLLDATVIKYQRRRELGAQMDYVERRVRGVPDTGNQVRT